MKITFLGAARTVTGSCYWLNFNNKNILIDCGMFQGHAKENDLNKEPFPFDAKDIDYVFLTHAHIDHSGRIPKLCKEGFVGQIITTKATSDLCSIMLPDSGYIQEHEAEWKNRKRIRAGKELIEPLYTYNEAIDSLQYFKDIKYDEIIDVESDLKVRFVEAGHILGSASIEIWVTEDNKETKIVFSGDIGNNNLPLLREPAGVKDADYLIIESTYGNRLHKEKENKIHKLMRVMRETIRQGGNVIIPSFAVGRTQEIIYEIHKYKDEYPEYVQFLKDTPIYVDSPLATSATEIFRKNLDCFDDEAREYIKNGDNPLDFPGLIFTKSPDESRELNDMKQPKIILSASGMCEAGRIRHHLKHNLWRSDSSVLFVGYQAVGTLGRRLIDGIKKVKLFGEEILVKSNIATVQGYSGHADQDGLLKWVSKINDMPKKVFIVHGEVDSQKDFAEILKNKYNLDCVIPEYGDDYELTHTNNAILHDTYKVIKDRFVRLQLIAQIEILQEQAEIIANNVTQDCLNDKSDEEVVSLRNKILSLEDELLKFKKDMTR